MMHSGVIKIVNKLVEKPWHISTIITRVKKTKQYKQNPQPKTFPDKKNTYLGGWDFSDFPESLRHRAVCWKMLIGATYFCNLHWFIITNYTD